TYANTKGVRAPNLARLKFLERTALTRNTKKFEDIEGAARRLFRIEEDVSIIISAEIPSVENERVEIDPEVWPIVSGEVSVAWITKLPHRITCSADDSTTKELSRPMSPSDPDARRIKCIQTTPHNEYLVDLGTMIVHKNATLYDLKRAIWTAHPYLKIHGLHFSGGPRYGHQHSNSCWALNDSCSFYYDETCVFTP
ncbi:hypothetical protein M408DRAFT_328651, partial [Serendipita vermifera MAFF 305830]